MRVAGAAPDGRFFSVWEIERSVNAMFDHFAWNKISEPVGKHMLFGESALVAEDAFPWWFCHNELASALKNKSDQGPEYDMRKRVDDALRRALSTPQQPHKPSGKSKASPKQKAGRAPVNKPGD